MVIDTSLIKRHIKMTHEPRWRLLYVIRKVQGDETNQHSYIKFRHIQHNTTPLFLILKFCCVVDVLFFSFGQFPGESQLFFMFTQLMKIEQTEFSKMLAYKIQTPRNHPKDKIQHYTLNFYFVLCVCVCTWCVWCV